MQRMDKLDIYNRAHVENEIYSSVDNSLFCVIKCLSIEAILSNDLKMQVKSLIMANLSFSDEGRNNTII